MKHFDFDKIPKTQRKKKLPFGDFETYFHTVYLKEKLRGVSKERKAIGGIRITLYTHFSVLFCK